VWKELCDLCCSRIGNSSMKNDPSSMKKGSFRTNEQLSRLIQSHCFCLEELLDAKELWGCWRDLVGFTLCHSIQGSHVSSGKSDMGSQGSRKKLMA
jgi:hypothetical protein